MSTAKPKFTLAVVGGGIAGLTLCIALSKLSSKKDIDVHVYEAASQLTEIGAGVGIFRRPWGIMKALNVDNTIKKVANVPESEEEPRLTFEMRKSDQPQQATDRITYNMLVPFGIITLHRVDFQRGLAEHLDQSVVKTHFNKRLANYSFDENGVIKLHFKDGSEATCDVLIGADGLHSATRSSLFSLAIKDAVESGDESRAEFLRTVQIPIFSGSVAYRAVIPSERVKELNPNHRALHVSQNYMGKNKHIIAFPIQLGKFVNIVAFCSDPSKEGQIWEGKMVEEVTKDELVSQYEGWEPEVCQLTATAEKPNRWAITTLTGIPFCTYGNVALIGDAAHAMTPHQGSGAGQAMEDAYVLAALLTLPSATRATLPQVLKVYEDIRLPHGNDVQRRSRENGKLYEFSADDRFPQLNLNFGADGNAGRFKDEKGDLNISKLLNEVGDTCVENWKWTWTTNIEDDKNQAMQTLEKRLGQN